MRVHHEVGVSARCVCWLDAVKWRARWECNDTGAVTLCAEGRGEAGGEVSGRHTCVWLPKTHASLCAACFECVPAGSTRPASVPIRVSCVLCACSGETSFCTLHLSCRWAMHTWLIGLRMDSQSAWACSNSRQSAWTRPSNCQLRNAPAAGARHTHAGKPNAPTVLFWVTGAGRFRCERQCV